MRILTTALCLLIAGAFAGRAEAQYTFEPEAEPVDVGEWHFDLDAAIGTTTVHFLTATDVAHICPIPPCGIPDISEAAFRATGGFGYKGISLEGAYTMGLDGPPVPSYRVLHIGFRFDTSWDGLFSLFFRFQVAHRLGDVGGDGAHAALGILARPHQMIAFYGEMSGDITTGASMNGSVKPLFSYATMFVGGVRLSFGP